MRKPLLGAAFGLLAFIASAHASLAGEITKVTISNLAYSPAEITVRKGDIVEWINKDFIDHTATAKDGAWDVLVAAGQAAQRQMTKTGSIRYFCRFHPNMIGTIHVVGN